MGAEKQVAFLSCSSLIESLTPTSELPTVPLPVTLQVYFQPSAFSYKAVVGPRGQSLSLLFLQALLKKTLLSPYLHPTTRSLAVIQLLVCRDHRRLYWQIQSQQYIVVSFLSVSFFSPYLILSVSAVCSRSLPCTCHPPPSAKAPKPQSTKS